MQKKHYENISDTLNDKVNNLSELESLMLQMNELFLAAQEVFAEESGFMISTEDHPLDQEIDNL